METLSSWQSLLPRCDVLVGRTLRWRPRLCGRCGCLRGRGPGGDQPGSSPEFTNFRSKACLIPADRQR